MNLKAKIRKFKIAENQSATFCILLKFSTFASTSSHFRCEKKANSYRLKANDYLSTAKLLIACNCITN